jgi:hypothetical protein
MYWAVAGCKVDGYKHFFVHLNGTDLIEQLFAMVRLCSGNSDTNVRQAALGDRLQAGIDILGVKDRGNVAFQTNRRLDKGVDHLKPDVWIRDEHCVDQR